MNERIENLMYHAGLTAQGCWDKLDEYDKAAIEKFAELIIKDCVQQCESLADIAENINSGEIARKTKATAISCGKMIKLMFGVE